MSKRTYIKIDGVSENLKNDIKKLVELGEHGSVSNYLRTKIKQIVEIDKAKNALV